MKKPMPACAYQWLLAQLRQRIRQAPNSATANADRKRGRRVLANYKAAYPHLHTVSL